MRIIRITIRWGAVSGRYSAMNGTNKMYIVRRKGHIKR